MAENSKIEWTDHTFNPWIGCTKVGPGCDHCYAEGWARRAGKAAGVTWGGERRRTSPENWRQPLAWNAQAEREGRRYRVFCASLADVFDNQVPPEWRADLFRLIESTPNLDWLLLTKRVGNAAGMMFEARGGHLPLLPNVWLGATVVDQAEADRDVPKLLAVPARIRFLSVEPMLGPIDIQAAINRMPWQIGGGDAGLHWVICGGESGPGARPMHPDWAGSLRDQCAAAGVPFLFKQHGEWLPISQQDEAFTNRLYRSNRTAKLHEDQSNLDDIYGRTCTVPYGVVHLNGSLKGPLEPMAFLQGTGAMTTFKVGKKAAGRLLDGRTHDGFPA